MSLYILNCNRTQNAHVGIQRQKSGVMKIKMTESEFVRGLSLNILCCLVAYTFQPTVRVLHETSRVQTIIFQGHDCPHHAADLRALILFPLIVHANMVVLRLL